jgi:energy-coupling factor transport system substrate-specific component
VSWPAASFAILAAALAAGFAWYERSRPSSRVVSMVATLAALAALGRIAFAPLPNVKPTTDIVLLAGFVLGGPAGFAVGALAALSSNFVLGQGPWTPWQMAAWGGVGVAGALLGRATRQRIGRWALAGVCALAGLAFGAVMNFSTWVTFTGRHTMSEYLAIAVTALPFDLAHAIGNATFALLFGPALLGALRRFRLRFEVTWRPAPGVVAALLLALAMVAAAGPPAPAVAATPASYLERAQNSDGGFGAARGRSSSQLYTAWAALGLAAVGRNPADVQRGGRSPVDFIRTGLPSLGGTGDLERTILVLGAAGVPPRDFGGHDLVGALERRRRRNGSIGGLVNLTSFGIFALRAAGGGPSSPSIRAASTWLAGQQNADGGFSFSTRGAPSGVDDTSAALQALVAAGRAGRSTARAAAFLRRRQNRDGGFPLQPGGASNSQSTAFVVQAIVAAGGDPGRLHRNGARSPIAYLRAMTRADGSVRYSRTSTQTPVWVTAQAAMALARRPFPLPRGQARTGAAARGAVRGVFAASEGAPVAAAAVEGDSFGGGAKAGAKETTQASAPGGPAPLWWMYDAHDLGVATGWVLSPLR